MNQQLVSLCSGGIKTFNLSHLVASELLVAAGEIKKKQKARPGQSFDVFIVYF